MKNDQYKIEEPLWQEARAKLTDIYGDKPPLEFISRLYSEEMIMRGSGAIEHFKMQEQFMQEGKGFVDIYTLPTSLTAWLFDVTPVNPLPPHTVCPKCRKTVIWPNAADGWDLPRQKCECGSELIRDGHNLHVDLVRYQFNGVKRQQFEISSPDEPLLRKAIQEQYQDRWKLVEYKLEPEGDLDPIVHYDKNKSYLLVPQNTLLPYRMVDGVYQVPFDEWCSIGSSNEMIVDIYIHEEELFTDAYKSSEPLTLDEVLAPENIESLMIQQSKIPARYIGTTEEGTVSFSPDIADVITQKHKFTELRLVESEDIFAWLPRTNLFSDAMQLSAFCIGPVWTGFAKQCVESGTLALSDIPMTKEAVFDYVVNCLRKAGITDNGMALKAVDMMRGSALTEELLQDLKSIGCDKWFIDYLRFVNDHLIDTKSELVKTTYERLYKQAYAGKNAARDGSGKTEETIPDRPCAGTGKVIYAFLRKGRNESGENV